MSRSLQRSILVSPGQRWANILAIYVGVAFAVPAASALGYSCIAHNIGPLTEGQVYDGIVATILHGPTDNPGGASIDWGDGTVSAGPAQFAGCVHGRGPCLWRVEGIHTYSEILTGVTIKIQSATYSCSTPPFDVVAPPPPPPPPPPPGGDVLSNPTLQLRHAMVNIPVTGSVATFSDSNPSAVVSDFTALIDWGDGTHSAGVVSGSGGALSVSAPGDHAYGQRGVVTVSVSLSAPGVTTSTATGTVRVRH